MRFFTFLFIACVTAISINAFSIELSGQSDDTRNCPTVLSWDNREIKQVKQKLAKFHYEFATIQSQEQRLIDNSKKTGYHCCKSLRADVLDVSYIIKALKSMTDNYIRLLSDLKSKKPDIDKDPAANAATKKMIETVGSIAINLYNCLESNAASDRQTDLKDMKSKFSSAYTEVQKLYGV